MTGNNSALKALADLRTRNQRDRIRFSNRLSAIERGDDSADEGTVDVLGRYLERFQNLEKEATRDMVDLVRGVEIVERMTEITGIGDTLAAMIYSMVDISKDEYVSSLWRYAGYAVGEDGKRERPKKGEKLHYNVKLKTTLYLVSVSMLRSSSPYRAIYDEAKEYYTSNRPDWTKAHCHQASLRKMIKVFLQHLWLVWRTVEGLPTNTPYVQDKLNHNHIIRPQAMGWSDFGEG